MALTSLQVCMDSSDWLQGEIHEDAGMDSSSPSGEMLTCSGPLIERRLRPPHDQVLKCPRCDSTHTKFCYYNNYSLSQPRYFCKTCRRYWTKGGTLRNIPVGGGCRKNKKVSSKKPNDHPSINQNPRSSSSSSSSSQQNNPTHLQLSFPADHVQFGGFGNYNAILENPRPIDFMENKYETLLGSSRNYDFMGSGGDDHDQLGMMNFGLAADNYFPPIGLMSINCNNGGHFNMDMSSQRLMLPYEGNDQNHNGIEVKPNAKLLTLEWPDHQGCSNAGKDSFGYLNGLGSWSTGLMNGYGSSTTNPLV